MQLARAGMFCPSNIGTIALIERERWLILGRESMIFVGKSAGTYPFLPIFPSFYTEICMDSLPTSTTIIWRDRKRIQGKCSSHLTDKQKESFPTRRVGYMCYLINNHTNFYPITVDIP
jgi:hypothetical protein